MTECVNIFNTSFIDKKTSDVIIGIIIGNYSKIIGIIWTFAYSLRFKIDKKQSLQYNKKNNQEKDK